MFLFTLAALASVTLPLILAHGGVLSYSWEGNWYWGWLPYNSPVGQTSIQRPWAVYDPILDPTSYTISCNDDGSSSALQLTGNISAGSAVTAYWNVWPHNTGPILTYLAQCPGSTCTGVNSSSLSWFKIQEAGLINGTIGTGTWAAGVMMANNNSWTTTIPKTVPSGNYLIRFETIALHSLPAQFYPECAQINIINGGSLAPTAAQLVKLPGAYASTDPGLSVDIYSQDSQTNTVYVIPGPPLYGSSSSSTTTASSTTKTSSTSSGTTKTSSTSSSTTKTSTSSSPTTTGVAQYGQCGGIGWTGGTVCASPYVCTELNDYYYQCI